MKNTKNTVTGGGTLVLKTVDRPAPPLYRADLFKKAKAARYSIGYREIADLTRLSVNTVRDVVDGQASKIDSIYIVARFFGIPWLDLFDVDRELPKLRGEKKSK
jgi:hypothetical protein